MSKKRRTNSDSEEKEEVDWAALEDSAEEYSSQSDDDVRKEIN